MSQGAPERERAALAAQLEEVYQERNRLVLLAFVLAHQAGYDVGLIHDPEEPDWPVLALQAGAGPQTQLSWHVPRALLGGKEATIPRRHWDGHSTPAKAARLASFVWGAWPFNPAPGGTPPPQDPPAQESTPAGGAP